MNYKLIFTLLLSLQIFTLSSQEEQKYFITTDFHTKFSIGTPSRDIIQYEPDVSVNVPKVSKFRNPVYGIDLSFNYLLKQNFSIGLGSGLNVSKYMYNPVEIDEYYDKVMIPVYLRLDYKYGLKSEWMLVSNLNLGYQFSDQKFDNTDDGFVLVEKGGLIAGIDIGIGKKANRFSPQVKLGYEFNCFNNEHSLVNMGFPNIVYNDKINYRMYYHVLKLSLGIKI